MSDADRCVCCGAIIPEGSHVCPNCKAVVNREMDAYAYLVKYMNGTKREKTKDAKECEFCPTCGRKMKKRR